jgi:hypothetical protein
VRFAKYEVKQDSVTKDGHKMFPEDIARELNRKSYLEEKLISINIAIGAIAILQERFGEDYKKFSDSDNISFVVDMLAKLKQHQ